MLTAEGWEPADISEETYLRQRPLTLERAARIPETLGLSL
jgi:hypothetical protein